MEADDLSPLLGSRPFRGLPGSSARFCRAGCRFSPTGCRGGRPSHHSGDGRGNLAAPVNQREPDLVPDGVKAPDLVDLNLTVLTETAGDVDHAGGHIEEEGRPQLGEMCPLSERLEMVDRFASLDLDDRFQTMPTIE